MIILFHAYTGSSSDVRMTARALEKAGYSVYVPHFSGHGTLNPLDILTSGGPEKWRKDAEDAYQFVLKRGYQAVSVFGLSLGGIYAMYLLEQHGEIECGGVFSSPIYPTHDQRIYEGFLQYGHYVLQKQKMLEEDATMASIRRLLPAQLRELENFTEQEVIPLLSTIKQPVFIAQGMDDELIDPNKVDLLQEALKDAKVVLRKYPDASHVITVNQAHKRLEEDLLNFLENKII